MLMRLEGWSSRMVAVLSVVLSPWASSQTITDSANVSAGDEMSEIVVTARRVDERAQDVPISMTVFNQQLLSDRNIVTAGDLAAATPSMSVDNSFGQDVTTF